MMKSILIVAPKSSLENLGDLLAAARGFQVTVLNGLVNSREVLREIASGDYQIVHFAGEGSSNALLMSDGPLEEDRLRRAFSSNKHIEAVIFNACSSIATAAELYREGAVPRVISWRVDVLDRIAIEWATLFYETLAASGDYWSAHATAAEVMQIRHSGFEAPIYLNGRIVLIEQQVNYLREQVGDLAHTAQFAKRLLMAVLVLSGVAAIITFNYIIVQNLIR